MAQREGRVARIGELIAERTIEMDAAFDPITRGGFTQVPNFILTDGTLSLGAKVAYSMFLHYAWHKDSCFPGQDTLGKEMGMSKSRVNEFIKELERVGLVEIRRRGQGKTNIYRIKFVVKGRPKQRNS
jgi:biotin operon repressor